MKPENAAQKEREEKKNSYESSKKDNTTSESAKYLASTVVQGELISTYGEAIKQDIVAYTGVDHETGQVLTRSLKKIHEYKINPQDASRNINQQAGYAAEVKQVAEENKKAILSGKKVRTVRTDDIGRMNDPLYDYVQLDEQGHEISHSGVQVKFINKNGAGWFKEFMRKEDFQKYLDHDAKICVPKDYYGDIQKAADQHLSKLQKQLEHARSSGDREVEKNIQAQIDKANKLKESIQPSDFTKADAIEGKMSPKTSTFKSMNKTAMEAAKDSALFTGAIVGSLTIVENGIKAFRGECTVKEAIKNSAITTTESVVVGYASGYGGSILSGFMQSSSNTIVRALGKTPLSQTIVVAATLELVKAGTAYFQGKITGVECLARMGKSALSTVASISYGTAGALLLPTPAAGAMIGGLAGWALVTACYRELTEALKDAELAKERRIEIEKECQTAITAIQSYRKEVQDTVRQYLIEYQSVFDEAFISMEKAFQEGDANGVISGANRITSKLGGNPEFNTVEEFEVRMMDDKPFKL